MSDAVSGAQILALFESDQQEAIARLFEEYNPLVYRVVRRAITNHVRRQYDSTELVNSTFLAVICRLQKSGKESPILDLANYLKEVARNKIIAAHKKSTSSGRRRTFETGDNEKAVTMSTAVSPKKDRPSQPLHYAELLTQLRTKIGQEFVKIAVEKSEGKQVQVLADELGVSRRTIERMFQKARKMLDRSHEATKSTLN